MSKEIANSKVCTVGSHGVKHELYHEMTAIEARKDLEESRKRLEGLIGSRVDMYAFPYGSYYACGYTNKHLAGTIYKYAFGTVACPITKPSLLKNYFLPRINADVKFINNI